MGYAEILPPPALRPLVACYWAISGPAGEHRVLPDGCIDILVMGESARVVGTMRRAIVAPAHRGAAVGVRFRPGEAARFLPEAPRELTDADAPLEALWGDDARALEGALLESLESEERAEDVLERARTILDASLRARLASHGEAVDVRVRAAVALLASGAGVRDTAARVELSERQLARRFADRVGVAPKLFSRVMRLQRAAAILARGATPSIAATEAGYADQAHFTRDAAELAGASPAALSREMSDSFKPREALAS
ncbi:MAG: AraC family transcriptional regulator [Labilithrix sp.]|nr:AraC family transcriptional regulator [Labilithrix sp.]